MITFRRLGKLGRFGNQLFQYAGARLYAEQNGFDWTFPDWDGDKLFAGISNDKCLMPNKVRRFFIPTIQLSDLEATSWSERLLTPLGLWKRGSMENLHEKPRDNVNLYGYLQDDFSLSELREHADTVRGWLRIRTEVGRVLRDATAKYRPWLAVHIRRGDMVKRGIESNIEDAVSHVERLQRGRNLFIATDDPTTRSAFASFCPFDISQLPLNIPPWATDFWMLKEADALIGSGSTFAWWAAFLGNQQNYWSPPLNRTWKGLVPPIEHQTL